MNEACRQFLGASLLLLPPPRALLLLQNGIPPTGCRPSQTDPAQASLRLQLQHNSMLWGPSFRNSSSMGPHGQQLPEPSCHTAAPLWASSYVGSAWAMPPSGLIHCCPVGSSMDVMWRSTPCGTWGQQGDCLHLHGLPLGCRELLLQWKLVKWVSGKAQAFSHLKSNFCFSITGNEYSVCSVSLVMTGKIITQWYKYKTRKSTQFKNSI